MVFISIFNIAFCFTFDLSSSAMTFVENAFDDCCQFFDFVWSTLAKVGIRSTFWQRRRNSMAPSHLICLLLNCSRRLNKCSRFSRFRILIRECLDRYYHRLGRTIIDRYYHRLGRTTSPWPSGLKRSLSPFH